MMSLAWTKTFTQHFLDLIYPTVCAACGRERDSNDSPLCNDCFHSIPVFRAPLCNRCGAPLHEYPDPRNQRCRYCPEGKIYFDRNRSLYSYKDRRVKNMIHALKFDYQTRLAKPLSLMMLNGYRQFFSKTRIDALVPIPLHITRYREREFNQARLLCREIERREGLNVREDLILRTKRTPPQSSLNPKKRLKNLEDAFETTAERVADGLRVLLIDDVMTTGATINFASAALRRAGAAKIYSLTLAQTIEHPDCMSVRQTIERDESRNV